MARSHTKRRDGFGSLSQRISPGLIYGYSCTAHKVHIGPKQGQIPVPNWLLYPFLGQGPVPGEGSNTTKQMRNQFCAPAGCELQAKFPSGSKAAFVTRCK